MNSGSLDTNILVRFIAGNKVTRAQASHHIKGFADGATVADVALIELAHALRHHYQYSREQLVDVLIAIVSLPQLICNRYLFEKALMHFENHPKLSLEDCYLAARAELYDQEPLWTFDKKLASQVPAAQLVA